MLIKRMRKKAKENERSTVNEVESHESFQDITAKDIAEENGIEYTSKAKGEKLSVKGNIVNQYYIARGQYILLSPVNDGFATYITFEWYKRYNRKTRMIIDNQSSFKCITNLSDILLQMVRLYTRYIDEDVFIDSDGFAIRLDDEVRPRYKGSATLVLTDDAICNKRIKPDETIKAKKYFVNTFLDRYIGLNFGVAITSNPQLEKELLELNNLVISKGLREKAGPNVEVISSEDVKQYFFKTA